ncbi:hypothetical protein GOPIP_006_01140 [Gordonia polyisoprenivorans NBRC 16320 = JCM 10675]|uniref:Uncharacterized protein n=1 Tax=Gordonia polyisoprenivorans TaxID=84595 RepID=A0A846WPA7_9ACTN|nr:hypothetical protein [Gordonia polyisoprenivorans]NKY02071.1 hypothetical protein [Gordonia polyisoprenivorans]GAB21340.1 hypothetical protein GOPIP_006_01140 [Gordonia polyisoprenivorans NBRC 16320 = JCM 10675]
MSEPEDGLRRLGSQLADIVVHSTGELAEGPWDRYMSIDHFEPGHTVGTETAWAGGERIRRRPVGISMPDLENFNTVVEDFRREFPVPFWLFDAMVVVVDREPVRGVVHVVCGDVAADFEASMATAREVKARAIDMFGDLSEPSMVCGRPILLADGASAVDRVAAFVAVNPVLGFVVEDAVVSRVDGGWRVFVRDRPGEVRIDRTYFLVADDGGVFPVSSGEPPADAVARLLGRR